MKKIITDGFIILFITLLVLEIVLRILQYEPYQQEEYQIYSEPELALVPHEEWGLALKSGRFTTTINEGLTYKATHEKKGVRSSGFVENDSMPEIHFYGCSFTYGMGVNDEETFSYLLQQKIKNNFKVVNFGVPAYGNVQGFLQSQKRIKKGEDKTKYIFAVYADFHEERNILTSSYRAQMHYGLNVLGIEKKKGAAFPFVDLKQNQLEVNYCRMKDLYQPVFLRNYSALSNVIQEIKNNLHDKELDPEQTTLRLFSEWNTWCEKNNIQFVIVSLLKNERSKKRVKQFRENGMVTLDLGLDILCNDKLNNAPYDSHPNAAAHRIYAERIFNYLQPDHFD